MLPMSFRNLVFDTIEAIGALGSLAEVRANLLQAAERLGFDAFGIATLPPAGEDTNPAILAERMPNGFRDLYSHERFYTVDHIAAHARTAHEPFRFSDAPYGPGESRRCERFMQALGSYQIGQGVVVPVGRVANIPACIWLAGKNPEVHDEAMRATQLIALFTASKLQGLWRAHQSVALARRLSTRERDVLQWISAGKTSWEVSVIAGLSESATNNIVARAMKKLDAVTRVQAVANAIRQGEIEL